jgi:hypothetical protein
MKLYGTIIFMFCAILSISAQNLSGEELLDKAIQYHDPTGAWTTFNGTLNVTMETPKGANRVSKIDINLPQEYFSVRAMRDTVVTTYTLAKEVCTTSIMEVDPKAKRTPCETAELYKNYYTYLFGLPMKLKDPGTNVSEKVRTQNFKGKDYLVLQVHYDQATGSDVWQFYFDPTTYAMEIYQFFKGDPEGDGKNTGEYILLKNLKTINGVKFPKERAWYYNKDNGYLGTDILK